MAGLAVAQPRAQRGRGGHTISAEAKHAIHRWREGVRYEAQRAMAGQPPFTGAVRMETCYLMPRSKELQEAKWAGVVLPYTKKPDIDNLNKALWDACKMVTWSDDCLVTDERTKKRYTFGGEPPGVYVRMTVDTPTWSPALHQRILELLTRR